MEKKSLQRVCFLLHVKKEWMEEYRRRHREVWPELLEAFRETGWHNFSLYLTGDGTLIGYVETPDFDSALEAMGAKKVNDRWQAEMREFFEDPLHRSADRQIVPLEEIFHLD